MYLNYDSKVLNSSEPIFEIHNRSFRYGDALFETMIFTNSNLQWFEDHWNRLLLGMYVLKLQANKDFSKENILAQIIALCHFNNLTSARVRLQVWRAEGGLYTPDSDGYHYVIETLPLDNISVKFTGKIGIAETIHLHQSPISKLKTANSLPYIMAGLEKKERQLDDLILLDNRGYLSEGISSNLFWVVGKKLFTPDLDTGCIAGIRRGRILKSKVMDVTEARATPMILLNADVLFFTNVTGYRIVNQLDNILFNREVGFEIVKMIDKACVA